MSTRTRWRLVLGRFAEKHLTRETDQVAGVVAGVHGRELGRLAHIGFSEAEMLAALRLNAAVEKSLAQDGLVEWIGEWITERVP